MIADATASDDKDTPLFGERGKIAFAHQLAQMRERPDLITLASAASQLVKNDPSMRKGMIDVLATFYEIIKTHAEVQSEFNDALKLLEARQ